MRHRKAAGVMALALLMSPGWRLDASPAMLPPRIQTSARGNVFVEGEAVRLRLSEDVGPVRWTLRDWHTIQVALNGAAPPYIRRRDKEFHAGVQSNGDKVSVLDQEHETGSST